MWKLWIYNFIPIIIWQLFGPRCLVCVVLLFFMRMENTNAHIFFNFVLKEGEVWNDVTSEHVDDDVYILFFKLGMFLLFFSLPFFHSSVARAGKRREAGAVVWFCNAHGSRILGCLYR